MKTHLIACINVITESPADLHVFSEEDLVGFYQLDGYYFNGVVNSLINF